MSNSNKVAKTTEKPPKKAGRGGIPPPDNGVRFSEENQPSPEQKRIGWLKKKRGPELVKAILDMAFQGRNDGAIRRDASKYFGIAEDNITNEMMLIFKQAELAVQKSNTQAFTAVMDRAYGKPKEKLEHSGPDDGPIATKSNGIDYSKLPLPLRKQLLAHIRSNDKE